jgi:Sulfotransferase domain
MHDHETKAPRVSIVSFPKSGRTWLRVLIGKALCEQAGLDDQQIFDKDKLAEATGLPKINYTHEDSGNSGRKHYQELETDKSKYKQRKVIMLMRDPRDVLVSYYLTGCEFCNCTASDNPTQEVSGRAPRHHCVGNAWASDQADQALGGVCCFRFFSLLGGTGQGGHVTGTGRANASRRSGVICQGRNALRSVGL